MQIKVIKKGTISDNEAKPPVVRKNKRSFKDLEKKVEENISGWISELRQRKSMEFLRTQSLITTMR